MINLKTIGRVFFAMPILIFGVQYLTYGRFVRGLPPVPPWAPGGAAAAYLTGALLVAAGVCILANVQVRLSAVVLGMFCFVCVVAIAIASGIKARLGSRIVRSYVSFLDGSAACSAGICPYT